MGDKHLTDEEIDAMFSSSVANADVLRLLIVDMWDRWRNGELSENQLQLAIEFSGGKRASRITTMIVADDVDSQPEQETLLGARTMSIFKLIEKYVAEGDKYTAALVRGCTDEVDGG